MYPNGIDEFVEWMKMYAKLYTNDFTKVGLIQINNIGPYNTGDSYYNYRFTDDTHIAMDDVLQRDNTYYFENEVFIAEKDGTALKLTLKDKSLSASNVLVSFAVYGTSVTLTPQ
jgi:hypothetical protein